MENAGAQQKSRTKKKSGGKKMINQQKARLIK